MSFQDLEGTSARPLAPRSGSPDIARSIFQLNTAVSGFWRLVDSIGTAKDTVEHRQKLVNARQSISKLVKDVSAKLKSLNNSTDPSLPLSKKLEGSKLARDFQAVLLDFQKAQTLATEREAAYVPSPSKSRPTSSVLDEDTTPHNKKQENEILIREQKRQEISLLENELVFNEAIIEERDQEIKEIQYEVREANELFQDLAVLVHKQGVMIDDIDKNIETTATTTAEAEVQLNEASKSLKSKSSWCCWLWVVLVVVVVIIVLVIFV